MGKNMEWQETKIYWHKRAQMLPFHSPSYFEINTTLSVWVDSIHILLSPSLPASPWRAGDLVSSLWETVSITQSAFKMRDVNAL